MTDELEMDKELKDEFYAYLDNGFDTKTKGKPTEEDMLEFAAHFAEWQKNRDRDILVTCHLNGAKTMKEQLWANAVNGFIEGEQGSQEDEPHEVYAVSDSLDPEKYKIGDKVKVIVLKEND